MVLSFLPAERRIDLRRIVKQRVLHPDGTAGVILVFDFGFGKRGLVVHAPVDGAQALVDELVFVKRKKSGEHHRLILRRHGGVGLIETSEDADALELLALQVEEFLRVFAAFGAHRRRMHLQLLAAEFLVDFDLDGQAVAVPAGNVGRVETGHGFGFDDEILEAFVHCRAQVDGAAGVGRTVVQDVLFPALAGLADALVEAHLLPAFEHLRLVLGQPCLHGKAGLGQIDRRFQVRRHSLGSPN